MRNPLSPASLIAPLLALAAALSPASLAVAAENAVLIESWMLLPVAESNRPVIRARTLTKAERAEAIKLGKAYIGADRTMATLARLTTLAESGDRDAMLAIRNALHAGAPRDLTRQVPITPDNVNFFSHLSKILAALWTAQIWHRYGYEEAGRAIIGPCVGGLYGEVSSDRKKGVASMLTPAGIVANVNNDGIVQGSSIDSCGFELLGAPAAVRERGKVRNIAPAGTTILAYYNKVGSFAGVGNRDDAGDFYITGVRFGPIFGDAAFLEAKFQAHLAARRRGLLYDDRYNPAGGQMYKAMTLVFALPWYERYALETGRAGELQRADSEASKKIAAQLAAKKTEEVRRWNNALAAYRASPHSEAARNDLQYAASALGGGYWTEYEKLLPNRYGGGAVSASGGGSYGGDASGGYRQVEVRSYDSGGNYTGSTRTSAVWADIMKMTSGPPR